ncbi:hypothetical protein [Mycobacteroides abscessus]|uniref:hypothetical protein n=1 Tax=Mycobacteroides abscessus TaxID=36809 RepID=UPI001F2F34A7|nr:hypothetical protein [Mycobacteroides abscessus]
MALTFPRPDRALADVRLGLRTIGFRRRIVIAFVLLDKTVMIVGVFYGMWRCPADPDGGV